MGLGFFLAGLVLFVTVLTDPHWIRTFANPLRKPVPPLAKGLMIVGAILLSIGVGLMVFEFLLGFER